MTDNTSTRPPVTLFGNLLRDDETATIIATIEPGQEATWGALIVRAVNGMEGSQFAKETMTAVAIKCGADVERLKAKLDALEQRHALARTGGDVSEPSERALRHAWDFCDAEHAMDSPCGDCYHRARGFMAAHADGRAEVVKRVREWADSYSVVRTVDYRSLMAKLNEIEKEGK